MGTYEDRLEELTMQRERIRAAYRIVTHPHDYTKLEVEQAARFLAKFDIKGCPASYTNIKE